MSIVYVQAAIYILPVFIFEKRTGRTNIQSRSAIYIYTKHLPLLLDLAMATIEILWQIMASD